MFDAFTSNIRSKLRNLLVSHLNHSHLEQRRLRHMPPF